MSSSPWPTTAGVPSRADLLMEINEHTVRLQECFAMMGHLHQTEGNHIDTTIAHGWLGMSELMKRLQHQIIQLAKGRLN